MLHLPLPDISLHLVLLLVRVLLAVTFITASFNKSKNIRKFAKNNGLPVPIASAVAFVEAVAGTAILVGIFVEFAAAALALLMLGSMRLHLFVWHSPYWASKGGWEYDLLLFTLALVLVTSGGGRFVLI